jgi:hypothetical protein
MKINEMNIPPRNMPGAAIPEAMPWGLHEYCYYSQIFKYDFLFLSGWQEK